jgi:hypothetical protein
MVIFQPSDVAVVDEGNLKNLARKIFTFSRCSWDEIRSDSIQRNKDAQNLGTQKTSPSKLQKA